MTGKAREAAQLLAIRWGHRGCDVPAAFCDIDHIDEHTTRNGETNQANALPLCGVHNRWKHAHRLRGRRNKHGRVHLIKPDGIVIKPLGACEPVWTDESEAATETAQHPTRHEPDHANSDRFFTPEW